ncbi:5'-nucleotidase C-terminal domain-containing protein [Hymenobacter humi]
MLELTGAQVLQLLEQTATNQNPSNDLARVGGLLQTSGLDWSANLNRPTGQRVDGVQVNGKPLDRQRRYRVVTHNGMLSGIHRYATFAQGQHIQKLSQGVTEVVEAGLRRRGSISPPVMARVLVVPAK